MNQFIEIEYLAASALVQLMKGTKQREVSFQQLKEYGFRANRILAENNQDRIIFLWSKTYIDKMFRDYSDIFEVTADERAIRLREGKERDDLINTFLAYLSLDIIDVLRDKKLVDILIKKGE